MIIHLNGWPGSGKLTVGRVLARNLGGRLIDNHTLHNVAASLCDRQTREYWDTYYQVREIAYTRMRAMPKSQVFVMTNALTRENDREAEAWNAIKQLAADRSDLFFAVTLLCSLEENVGRVQGEERANNHKITDPEPLISWRSDFSLITDDAVHWRVIDNTALTPEAAAEAIIAFVKDVQETMP